MAVAISGQIFRLTTKSIDSLVDHVIAPHVRMHPNVCFDVFFQMVDGREIRLDSRVAEEYTQELSEPELRAYARAAPHRVTNSPPRHDRSGNIFGDVCWRPGYPTAPRLRVG